MSIYEQHILPHLIDCACGSSPIRYLRKQIVPRCYGKVLEIGMGSGLNLPFYAPENVEFVWGLEPSEGMRRKAKKNVQRSPVKIEWLDLPSKKIPLESNSVDSILLTFSLCTIEEPLLALAEMRRVLKPHGSLFFAEHGMSKDKSVHGWQCKLNPLWKKMAGGCNLNRPIDQLIRQSNFTITSIETFYQRNIPKFAGYIYLGEARNI